jgi:hypothetical protein
MSSSRLKTKNVDALSFVFSTSTIYLIVTVLLLCSDVHSLNDKLNVPRARVDAVELDSFNHESLHTIRNRQNHSYWTLSSGMRELIDNDDSVRLGWAGIVVKWSKRHSALYRPTTIADSPNKARGIRRKRSPWLDGNAAQRELPPIRQPEPDCGLGIGGINSALNGYHQYSTFAQDKVIGNETNRSQHNGNNKRIYNGQTDKHGEFSWLAQIKIFKGDLFAKSLCTGSIVSEWLILTAAHCVFQW